MTFHTTLSDVFTIIDDKTIKYRSHWYNDTRYFCSFVDLNGRVCKQNDRFTAYFDITSESGTKALYYQFGFATINCTSFSYRYWNLSHSFCISGTGHLYFSDEFEINKGLEGFALMDTTLSINTIVFSVDMEEKIGSIWNDKDEHEKINIKLPGPVFMIFGFGGTSEKILKLKKIIFH